MAHSVIYEYFLLWNSKRLETFCFKKSESATLSVIQIVSCFCVWQMSVCIVIDLNIKKAQKIQIIGYVSVFNQMLRMLLNRAYVML